jgi:orotate phosphoribosyltransferase
VLKAIERCLEEQLEIVHVSVLVDREEGGMEAIRARVPGVPVTGGVPAVAARVRCAGRAGNG